MINGKIYKIVADHTPDVYVGCSQQIYLSQRMACHRQNNRDGIGNYGDLFSDMEENPPRIELVLSDEFENTDMLRKKEREIMENTEGAINLRCAYLSPEEKKAAAAEAVKRYHASDKGKIALAKTANNRKIKKVNIKMDNLKHETGEELDDIIYMLNVLRDKMTV
tara:strand:+ start:369 stop:863 length:495 start_codon:yes stop_codon:yes gene_type:complete